MCLNAGACLVEGGKYDSAMGSGHDVSTLAFHSFYVLLYTDRSGTAVGSATSLDPVQGWTDQGWIDTAHFHSYTLPAAVVYHGQLLVTGTYETACSSYTVLGVCLYHQHTEAIWWATGSYTGSGQGIVWTFQGFLGEAWASSADTSLTVYDGQVYLFYRDPEGRSAIGMGVYDGAGWTLHGLIDTAVMVSSANAGSAVFGGLLYLAWQDVSSPAYRFATFDGRAWSAAMYLNQHTAVGAAMGVNILLYATAHQLYALYQGPCPACEGGTDYQLLYMATSNPHHPQHNNTWSMRALHTGQQGGNQGSLLDLQHTQGQAAERTGSGMVREGGSGSSSTRSHGSALPQPSIHHPSATQ